MKWRGEKLAKCLLGTKEIVRKYFHPIKEARIREFLFQGGMKALGFQMSIVISNQWLVNASFSS